MKKVYWVILLVLFFVCTLNAQGTDLVLQRVYFAPVDFKAKADQKLLSALPDMLYSLITTTRPIIKINYQEAANSIISITVGKKGKDQIDVQVLLSRDGKTTAEAAFSYTQDRLDFTLLKRFMENTARKFSSYLGEVKPRVKVTSLITDAHTKDVIQAVQFAEAMSTPLEINLWVGTLSKANTSYRSESGFSLDPVANFLFPLELDLVWYFEKQQGLQFILYCDYNDYMYFGYTSTTDDIPAASENLVFLGGVGYVFRTMGVFSTSYSISLLLGAIHVTAKENLVNKDSGQLSLSAGESTVLFYALMPLRISFSYNITPRISLMTNICFKLNPIVFFGMIAGVHFPYEASGAAVFMQFVSLGVAYRF